MSDLRNFEKWCKSQLTRLEGKPVSKDSMCDKLRYDATLGVLKEYHKSVQVHSQKSK